MLNIRQVAHLAKAIDIPEDRLVEVADKTDKFCEELVLIDPLSPKTRVVLNVIGDLRKIQDRILHRLLLRKLSPSPFAHGGIRGRHIKSNITAHASSVYAFT